MPTRGDWHTGHLDNEKEGTVSHYYSLSPSVPPSYCSPPPMIQKQLPRLPRDLLSNQLISGEGARGSSLGLYKICLSNICIDLSYIPGMEHVTMCFTVNQRMFLASL